MLKKVVSLIVGVACLVSMTGVFAASYTGTSTAYVGDKIEVTSYVTSDEADETVTYLVHRKTKDETANIVSDDIVYIDQYEFATAGEQKTFKYQTATTDIGATLLMGGDVTVDDTVPNAKFRVVDASDANKVYWGAAELPKGDIKAFPLNDLADGNTVTGVKIGETEIGSTDADAETEAVWYVSDSADTLYIAGATYGETATITITVEAVAATAATTLSMTYFDAANAEDTDKDDANEVLPASVVVIGEVKGDAAEFGIVLASSKEGLASATKLPALAKNADGQFAVRVYDDALTSEVYAVVYYKDAAGEYKFADNARMITIPSNQ
ncbi:MAG: hypothetical protein IJB80_03520 [Clostridia bacterium]|nr:hypothetical protein [Clostridia bacterium]